MSEKTMKAATFLASATILAGCAAPEVSQHDQAIEDYVIVGELQPADSVRTQTRDSYVRLTDYYAIYRAREGDYLLHFDRRCKELQDITRVTPDVRRDNRLRAGFDTLRGCRISEIYAMDEAQAAEIANMGDGR